MWQRNRLQKSWSWRRHWYTQNRQWYLEDLKHLVKEDLSHPRWNRKHLEHSFPPHWTHQWCQKRRHIIIQQRSCFLQRCHQRHRWLTRFGCCLSKRISQLSLSCWYDHQIDEIRCCHKDEQSFHVSSCCLCLNHIRRRCCRCRWKTCLIIINLEKCRRRSMDCIHRWKHHRIRIIHLIKGLILSFISQTWCLKGKISQQSWKLIRCHLRLNRYCLSRHQQEIKKLNLMGRCCWFMPQLRRWIQRRHCRKKIRISFGLRIRKISWKKSCWIIMRYLIFMSNSTQI